MTERYPSMFSNAQEKFYQQLFQLQVEDPCVAAAQLDKLDTSTQERLPNQTYSDIHSGVIGRSQVSSPLHINGLLLNSNKALICALRAYHRST